MTENKCPHCGYCPHCGRSNAPQISPWPIYYPHYPYYPVPQPRYVQVTCGRVNTGGSYT